MLVQYTIYGSLDDAALLAAGYELDHISDPLSEGGLCLARWVKWCR